MHPPRPGDARAAPGLSLVGLHRAARNTHDLLQRHRESVRCRCARSLSLSVAGGVAQAAPNAITVALPGDFPSLDPSKDTSPLGFNYRLNVFDALTELQRDGKLNPRLAESWTFSPDLTEWTFKLRQGVKFHDGSPFTADDVVFTINRIKADNASPVRTFIRLVDKVEKVDGHTVLFKLTQPYGIFHRQISYVNLMSKTYFDKEGDQSYATKPVGTGPYKLVRWIKDDRMELEANADYWRGAPAIKRATFRPIPSESSRTAALLSGEVDLVPTLPPSLIEQLKSNRDLDVNTAPSFRVIFVAFNVNKRPLDNAKVREAIDIAIDRPAITDKLLRGLGKPTGIMVPPMNIGYDPSFKPVPYDPQKAKQLVTESGYDGTPIVIQYPNNNIVMANEVVQGGRRLHDGGRAQGRDQADGVHGVLPALAPVEAGRHVLFRIRLDAVPRRVGADDDVRTGLARLQGRHGDRRTAEEATHDHRSRRADEGHCSGVSQEQPEPLPSAAL